jgi:UDP-glucose 4-epimerase
VAGDVLQVATGVETSILDLAQMAVEVAGRKVQVEHGPIRQGDIRKNYSSVDKIYAMLDWEPQVELMEGLELTWQWLAKV